ncbi:hypothetical protein LTR66_008401 [Elasticomyces elasticus]|nr:hypothetical protein LTR66_008401 [Elasticomyces elasticus]
MATLISSNTLPETLLALARVSQPSSYADYAALSIFASASVGYFLRGKAWDRQDPYNHIWYERPQEKEASGRAKIKETRNIAQKLEESGKQIVVFWGSQSGTAEGFANRLARECHLRFGLETMSADLSDYDPETIALVPDTRLVIFIISTFGEGDPSDNTAGLWEWIHRSENVSLVNLRYVAFGLGNRNYKYYNRVIDVVVEALEKLGSKSLMPLGRADDAGGGTEEDFMAWKETLFATFRQQLGYVEREIAHEPTLAVVEDESLEPIDLHNGEPVHYLNNSKTAAACSPIKAISMRDTQELFTSSSRSCLHIELDISSFPELSYKTGDHLSVWPSNPDVEVGRLLRVLGLTEKQHVPLIIKSLDATVKVTVPTPTSAVALFRYYLEICAPVSRDTILSLAQFAPTPSAKAFLSGLGKDRTAYAEFLARTHINLGRLLEVAVASDPASWANLPFSFIVEVLPTIQPRYYSISSSSIVFPRNPSITAVVSNTPLANDSAQSIPGLTTNYLLGHHQANSASLLSGSFPTNQSASFSLQGPKNALEGRRIFAHIRKSKFKLPTLASQAIIMVAAGTGIAPFRGFLQERARLKQMGKKVGSTVLFFGCRNPDEDYLYRDELAELQRTLSDELCIFTAFSRQGGVKVYVQDRVEEERETVTKLLTEDNANLYICGSASMAREVGQRVSRIMQEKQGWSDEEAKQWAETRKRSNKFQEDVWG